MLAPEEFDVEAAQLDGTLAHAFERALGFLVAAGGLRVVETGEIPELGSRLAARRSGQGPPTSAPSTCRSSIRRARTTPGGARAIPSGPPSPGHGPAFAGHVQPFLPADLGFYDLRVPETMGEQWRLAQRGRHRRLLRLPLLVRRRVGRQAGASSRSRSTPSSPGPTSPSATISAGPTRPGGATGTGSRARSSSTRPMAPASRRRSSPRRCPTSPTRATPAPTARARASSSTARPTCPTRRARSRGCAPPGPRPAIRRSSSAPCSSMSRARARSRPTSSTSGSRCRPTASSARRTISPAARTGRCPSSASSDDFEGLIYDYDAVIAASLSRRFARGLEGRVIAGVMPSWDNTARRRRAAHIAHGANPLRFEKWLRGLAERRLPGSYRQELFVNAWNEWAEKAVLEPSVQYGRASLDALAALTRHFHADAPMARIVLHIGTHKTATTTVQDTLAQPCAVCPHGIVYPRRAVQRPPRARHPLAQAARGLPRRPRRRVLAALARRIRRGRRDGARLERGALPLEGRSGRLRRARRDPRALRQRTVVCTLRNQLAYLQSIFLQISPEPAAGGRALPREALHRPCHRRLPRLRGPLRPAARGLRAGGDRLPLLRAAVGPRPAILGALFDRLGLPPARGSSPLPRATQRLARPARRLGGEPVAAPRRPPAWSPRRARPSPRSSGEARSPLFTPAEAARIAAHSRR